MVGLVEKIKPKVVTHKKNIVMPNTIFSKYGKKQYAHSFTECSGSKT